MQPACQVQKHSRIKVSESTADIARSPAASICRPSGNDLQSVAEAQATPRLADWHAFCSYFPVTRKRPLRLTPPKQ